MFGLIPLQFIPTQKAYRLPLSVKKSSRKPIPRRRFPELLEEMSALLNKRISKACITSQTLQPNISELV